VGARADRVIARSRAVDGDIALFAHGHVLRVLAARWIGLSAGGGQHFLLDMRDTGRADLERASRRPERGERDDAMIESKGRDVLW
jgi:broad specificity phosphatase PhoE